MGTLTANQPRLPGYCDHKLPTSCRLSSIPQCCACADERAHAASYSTYIDGIGYVPRGNRWQRYCWFCKEFWQHRVEASGLRPAQTRIPEVPDQTEFLRRWYEFHQGYRVAIRDGTEERIAVVGEDFRDVSPGFLPRTLEELRAGRMESELAEQEAREREIRLREQRDQVSTSTGPSLEDTLNQLLEATESEEDTDLANTGAAPPSGRHTAGTGTAPLTNIHAQSMNPTRSGEYQARTYSPHNREYQARRIAALRRELHRMRNGIERVISGLRYLGENVPDHTEATGRLVELGRRLDDIYGVPSQEDAPQAIDGVDRLANAVASRSQPDRSLAGIQARVLEERRVADEARRNRDQAASDLHVAEQELRASQSRLRQLQAEERTTENYIRLFGTREEMMQQGENYESPIGAMFTRADERFRVAEEVRREERTLRQVLEDEEIAVDPDGSSVLQRLSEIESRERDVWGVPRTDPPGVGPVRQFTLQPDGSQNSGMNITNIGTSVVTQADSGGMDGLEEYHHLLQEQVANEQGNSSAHGHSEEEARTLGREIMAPGYRSMSLLAGMNNELLSAPDDTPAEGPAQPMILAGPPGQQLDPNPAENNDRGLDAQHVLRALLRNDTLRSQLSGGLSADQVQRLQRCVEGNSLTLADRATVQDLLATPIVVWGTGLPSERNYRRRQRGEEVTFTPDALGLARIGSVTVHDIEVMAECFQMSADLRSRSTLTGIEIQSTLTRLQRGERVQADRDVLSAMIQSRETLSRARDLQNQIAGEPNQDLADRQASLERELRESAREGDFSRTELDAQRRATHAFALAAGRSAMLAGPAALLEQMSTRDGASRAAFLRLRESGYIPDDHSDGLGIVQYRPLSLRDYTAAPSASDSDHEHEVENEARGLDAHDSGRPDEPMTDEEMTMKLDCRICYSQLADIACLPCGHLVMCRWCSDQHSPVLAHDRTRLRRPAGCPVCRKAIRQKVRMFRA